MQAAQTPLSIPARTIGEFVTVFVGPMVLVSSQSRHGDYHSVMDNRCSCLGFSYRGTCRHIRVAAQAQEQDMASAEPPVRTVTGNLIWCVDCGCEKAAVGVRCRTCSEIYWVEPAR